MKEFIKKNKSLLLAIFIPLVSMIIIYVFNHIYPFGDKIVAVGDGYTQYPGLLNNFLNKPKISDIKASMDDIKKDTLE